jgi:hypothetical protein
MKIRKVNRELVSFGHARQCVAGPAAHPPSIVRAESRILQLSRK